MIEAIIFAVIFLAMFIEGMIGFGSALITMPILLQLLGIKTAPPAFALMALCTGILMLLRYRTHWNFPIIWRLLASSIPAIPVGILLAGMVDEHLAMVVLGLIIIAYALYALFSPRIPELTNDRWSFVAGFIAGLMHGAYNIPGPPLVIYANARRWQPEKFKSTLQTVFFINGFLIVMTHFLKGNVTPDVLHYFPILAAGGISGLLLGFWMDRYVKPEYFRRAVLVMLVVVGLSLVLK